MILHTLHTHGHNLSIKEISERTAIRTDDIVTTLQSLSLIKYWKGDHIIAVNSKQASLTTHLSTSISSTCSCVIVMSVQKLMVVPHTVPCACGARHLSCSASLSELRRPLTAYMDL